MQKYASNTLDGGMNSVYYTIRTVICLQYFYFNMVFIEFAKDIYFDYIPELHRKTKFCMQIMTSLYLSANL